MVPHWNGLCWANHPTVTQWQPLHPDTWVTTSPSGSRELLYHRSVHKGLLNLFSRYVLCMQVGYYLFQTTALHTVSSSMTVLLHVHIAGFCRSSCIYYYGIATSVDNRSRDRIPQPTQWRAHEESRDLRIKHHLTTAYHPQVIYAQQDSCTAFTVAIANVIASLQ